MNQLLIALFARNSNCNSNHLNIFFQGGFSLTTDAVPGTSTSSGLTLHNSANGNGYRMPPVIKGFLDTLDDDEWKSELFKLLQSQSFNQVEVDLFELLCKVLDQNLFAQVDWARNSCYFKELEVGLTYFLSMLYIR